jgi:hypothetical protein
VGRDAELEPGEVTGLESARASPPLSTTVRGIESTGLMV